MESLLRLLQTLSHWEQKRLTKYLDSPYFNTDARLEQLLEALLQKVDWQPQALFAHIQPGIPFSRPKLNNLISYLRAHIEDFLAQEHLRKNSFPLTHARLQVARQKGFQKTFDKQIRQHHRSTPETPHLQTHLQEYWISQEQDQLSLSLRKPQSAHLQSQLDALSAFHSLALLKGACQWANRKQVVQSDAQQLDTYVQQALSLDIDALSFPLHKLYSEVLKMLAIEEHERAYQQLSELLTQHMDTLLPDETKALCQYAQNYCIRRINQGNPAYLTDLFEWYQQLLERDLMYYQGYLQDADIKNMVALGVRLEKFDWIEDFLNTYVDRIRPERRDAVLAYNRAYLFHAKGELRLALRQLREADVADVYYELGTQTLLLKIYYELTDHEGLEAQLHAFEQRLRRNRLISAYQRKGYLNLIKFLRRLDHFRIRRITLAPQQQLHQIGLLQKRLNQSPQVININWLRNQLAVLEEKSH